MHECCVPLIFMEYAEGEFSLDCIDVSYDLGSSFYKQEECYTTENSLAG